MGTASRKLLTSLLSLSLSQAAANRLLFRIRVPTLNTQLRQLSTDTFRVSCSFDLKVRFAQPKSKYLGGVASSKLGIDFLLPFKMQTDIASVEEGSIMDAGRFL